MFFPEESIHAAEAGNIQQKQSTDYQWGQMPDAAGGR